MSRRRKGASPKDKEMERMLKSPTLAETVKGWAKRDIMQTKVQIFYAEMAKAGEKLEKKREEAEKIQAAATNACFV